MITWTERPSHQLWLHDETLRLLDFGRGALPTARGAAWLDDDGEPDPTRPVFTWITGRTAHVYALGHLLGVPGCRPIADRALAALRTSLHDDEHGGWFASLAPDGTPDTTKSAYAHAFVVLAASTAVVARLEGARELLEDALTVLDTHFWEPAAGLSADEWDRTWTTLDPYRGVNANMHSVEALLAAGDAAGAACWHERGGHHRRSRGGVGGRERLADPGTLRLELGAAPRSQRRPPRRPVQAVRRHRRTRPGVVASAASCRCRVARTRLADPRRGRPRAL